MEASRSASTVSDGVTVTTGPRLLATFDEEAGHWLIAARAYRVALGKSAIDLVSTAEAPLTARSFGK